MENNAIKQPAPSIISKNQATTTKKQYNMPKVAIADVPEISKTPLADTIVIRKQENPHKIYKLAQKVKNLNFFTVSSLGVITCGIGALICLLTGKKHK